jgi:hypothetical protein
LACERCSQEALVEVARRLAVALGHPEDVDLMKLFPDKQIRLGIQTAVERSVSL